MTSFPFHYKGAITLTDGNHAVDLHNSELWEEQDVEEVSADGVTLHLPGQRSWHGVARCVGVPRRLMELLGGEVGVRLADGRLGHAHVTAYCEDSVWVVEITGVGPTPHLNMI